MVKPRNASALSGFGSTWFKSIDIIFSRSGYCWTTDTDPELPPAAPRRPPQQRLHPFPHQVLR
jgi:hypothetical protein